jgi:hypothetical protein
VQKEVDLLNSSRQRLTQSSDLTTAFLNNAHTTSDTSPEKTQDLDIKARIERIKQMRLEANAPRSVGPAKEEPNKAPAPSTRIKSPSASAAVSSPTSPAVAHNPARFLSRSPAVEEVASESSSSSDSDQSSSDDESEEEEEDAQAGATADEDAHAAMDEDAQTPVVAVEEDDPGEEPDVDLQQDTQIEEAAEEEEEHDQEPDAALREPETAPTEAPKSSAPPAVIHLPSSPPRINGSTPRVESSQLTPSQLKPQVRQTPIPLPSNLVRTPVPSSQTNSTKRPNARYTGFRTLREQLADAETTPLTNGGKSYDPRTVDMTKLTAKTPSKPGMANQLGVDDDSDDESSSDSSSDSD